MRPQFTYRRQFNQPNRRGPMRPNGAVAAAIRRSAETQATTKDIFEAPYVSTHQFSDFAISDTLKNNIASKGYTTPTPIQDQAIPSILLGRDLIGIANTGTGKTAAFLIPLVEKVFRDRHQKVLIVTPTRELALQISEELRAFSRGMGIRWALVIGGSSVWRQKQDIREGANFVIGTPGRIKDLIGERILPMSQFRTVVLDEADRMVDIGFISDIKYFISLLPKERLSLFFSATVSGSVSGILSAFVRDPITVSVKKHDTVSGIEQTMVRVEPGTQKVDHLHDLLNQKGFDKVLIFGRTKWGVEKLTNELVTRGFKAGAIHGNKRQGQRQRILDQFKRNELRILLATDVASRGLDIEDVSHVINYDMPSSYDDYIHRIGRTGRANKQGVALTFVE